DVCSSDLSWKLPCEPAKATAWSLPNTCTYTCVSASHWVGLIFPGSPRGHHHPLPPPAGRPRRRRRAPPLLPRAAAAACMFISAVDFLSAVSFGGELRGDLAYR